MYCKYFPLIVLSIVMAILGCHHPLQSDKTMIRTIDLLSDACSVSPFLTYYIQAGYVTRIGMSLIKLELDADLHQTDDCGAPDCYGTHVTIYWHVALKGNECRVQTVRVQMENYFHCGTSFAPYPEELIAPEESSYLIKPPDTNLNNPNIESIELRSVRGTEMIFLERTNFYLENTFNSAISSRLRRMKYEEISTETQ